MKEAQFLRRGNQILDAKTREVVQSFGSINAAKKASSELQGARRRNADGSIVYDPSQHGNGLVRVLETPRAQIRMKGHFRK